MSSLRAVEGPFGVLWWQWLALLLGIALAWGLGRLLGRASRTALSRLFARTENGWDDALLAKLAGPLTLFWMLVTAYLLLPWLGLPTEPRAAAARSLDALGLLAFFWALWRFVGIVPQWLRASPWGLASPGAHSLLFVGERISKVALLAMGVIAALSQLGYPVASLIAGLGIGGLALALAAQKTVENLFGSLSLAVDQPIRVGDFVRVEDVIGSVEAIGLRSTRIRTLDRTLVSIPNGQIADMRLESFTVRDRLRLACTVCLEYGTTSPQIRTVLEGLECVLRSHPKIWPDVVVVRFKELAASSLDVEVMAWFQTTDWPEFQLIRQEVLLQFMEVVEAAGARFAFPTQTVHLVNAVSPIGDPVRKLTLDCPGAYLRSR